MKGLCPRAYTVAILLALVLGLGLMPNITASTKPQGFLSVKGTQIVDTTGRAVILRGVNYPGYQSDHFDPIRHIESSYAIFARFGFNVVRLPISWSNLEPVSGMFYEQYLTYYLDRDIRYAKKYGLYIIIDMHQFNWATRFGGDGAPSWTVQKYPPTEAGMRQAVSDFWNQTSLQDHLIRIWSKIAKKYANEPTIAGYDILNEPWLYSSVNQNLNESHLNSFYARTIAAIRKVDVRHMIFLEPANLHYTMLRMNDSNIVWSPHFYPLSFETKYYPQNITVLEADFKAKYKIFVLDMGVPMWMGEFGAFMPENNSSQTWLQHAVKIFDEYHTGWAWWAFYQTKRQPIPGFLSVSGA